MSSPNQQLCALVNQIFGDRVKDLQYCLNEVTLTVGSEDYLHVAQTLKTHPDLAFEQLMDLCGVD